MTALITLSDLIETGGEPRVRDMRLGEALGFDRPRKIRDLIESNLVEIEGYGSSPRRGAMITIGKGGRRPVEEYWLNEPQALLICMFSRTARAAEVRRQIIRVFMDWRRGFDERPSEPHVFTGELTFSQRVGFACTIAGALANKIGHDDNQKVYDAALEWAFRRLGPLKKPGAKAKVAASSPAARITAAPDDPIGRFVVDCVEAAPGERVGARLMYESYKSWCAANAVTASFETKFGRELSKRYTKVKGSTRSYLDCRLHDVPARPDAEPPDQDRWEREP